MPTRIAMVAPSAAICASARSTKITPRSTTCTPRYACIPVRIRLATNGQIRKGRISIGLLEPLLRRLECLAQQSNIVIKQFEVVRHVFFAAHRRQVLDDLATRFASNGLRSFQIEIRLNQDQLAILPLLFRGGQTLVELLEALLVVRRVRRIQFAQLPREALRDAPPVVGIEPVVRIAQRMDVSHRAGDSPSRDIKNLRKL